MSSAKDRWKAWLDNEFGLPIACRDEIAEQIAMFDEGYGKAMERALAAESKLDTIRLKCLDELKHDRRSPFEEGRMDFADVIWRMIVQEPPK